MGLFDIFRRHKKHEDTQEEESQAPKAEEQVENTDKDKAALQSSLTESAVNEEIKEAKSNPISEESTAELSTELSSKAAVSPHLTEHIAEESKSTEDTTSESTEDTTPVAEEAAGSNSAESAGSSTSDQEQVETAETAEATTESFKVANKAENEPAEITSEAHSEPIKVATSDETTEPEEESTAKKYDYGLEKSRTGFGARLNRFLANFRHVDEDFFDDLEDMLIESDVGYDMAMKLSDELREEVKLQNAKSKQDISNVIIEKMVELYDEAGKDENSDLTLAQEGPTVIMFVGVNGAGKTTTIGKMAALFKEQGKKVLLAAADTFRAGATEQLDVWAKRDGVDIVTGPEKGDPAAVVFDAVQKAKKENYDILFVDTAGRLQNKVNLMKELAKMKRILTREIPDAPHEVLLVLDATTGQNALNQAKLFKESTDVTGIVLTKLDGTARGGIVLAIRNELHLPVKYVGLGEKVDDLQKFDASEFVYGLFKDLVEVD
ncbi:signal recognition particle-docking protein FtsY [Limosilactobacillus fastidiosus]|uniref:Signal recognition particle receptor FtsY n=1 Tax=Limosilactobacillus fastidiosus TaxID=2759855 RepID=A0A7W3U0J3_9LACO|nr:signal recognition particle-docking protein FtsY [Limosilactobacillus fastidiosus]MBB1063765.1 signal recognition particle-docking protein FtsY [Limosilactobacillus fastidiosus]MBB1086706.1 signal recognition particle-docking protein FtsY [Limosilactobacillus fastidiosus]MCD7084340.1 signal recognition particle-docking protein FtsY [Limosilactobacillus fastidiosus]MCD7085567.1 signal recognition particle-docking protein FtsY [Limosilactobacillus fastidiosus]MCD7114798.1 signal recognition p